MSFDGDLQQGTRVSRQEDAEMILKGVDWTGQGLNKMKMEEISLFSPNL